MNKIFLLQASDKFNIPKKTKLFVEQSARERETSTLMHRVFQHDLYLLRLNTARSFVRSLQTSSNPISTGNGDESESIKLSAQVLGLGPVFKLVIGLCNTSTSTPSRYLLITFYCDDKMYRYEIDKTRGIKISNHLVLFHMYFNELKWRCFFYIL